MTARPRLTFLATALCACLTISPDAGWRHTAARSIHTLDPSTRGAFLEVLARHATDGREDDADRFVVEQIALAARLDDVRLQNRRLVFDVHALTRMRTAIEESVRDLAAQEESASKEAEALAAQSRDVLATVEAQTKEKVAATARLAALVADRNATEARIAGSAADLAALTRDLGVAQGELQVATQALSNRDHDLAQLVDAAEAPLGPLGRDVSELRASRARLLARADELRATLAESVKQRDSLAINVSALGRAVSAAELDLKASLASAELAEKAYGTWSR